MRKAGEEEDWKKKTRDREGCKILSDEAVKKLRAAPHPRRRVNEEERELLVSNASFSYFPLRHWTHWVY